MGKRPSAPAPERKGPIITPLIEAIPLAGPQFAGQRKRRGGARPTLETILGMTLGG